LRTQICASIKYLFKQALEKMPVYLTRLFAIIWATVIAVAAMPVTQAQQIFPTKPVRLVVPFSVGAQPDSVARIIAPKLADTWKQPVVVENRPGASGTIGFAMVAKAAADGHTLMLVSAAFTSSAATQPALTYDPRKDFAGVAQLGVNTQVLVVAAALGARSVEDIVALAKAKPGQLVWATPGANSGPYLIGERFRLDTGIKIIHVAFKGGPEIIVELLAGRSHYSFTSLGSALSFVRDGRLRVLAVAMPQRSPLLPDVPTVSETLPGFHRVLGSYGVLAPAKTPRPLVNQIGREIVRIVNLPEINEQLQKIGLMTAPLLPEEYDKVLLDQIDALSSLVQSIGGRAK
jgi:tripartite-type tricarboxylate transporter receptor subunit TctC